MLFPKISFVKRMVDTPNWRSSHTVPRLRGAGIIFSVLTIGYFIFFPTGLDEATRIAFIIGAISFTLLGFIDDLRFVISAKLRLLAQFIISVVVVGLLTNWFSLPFEIKLIPFQNYYFNYFVAVFFIVWVVNLFNFMDGLDGMAGAQAALWLCFLLGLNYVSGSHLMANIYWVILACLAPFIFFNWEPSRFFMGDSGAYFLGYCFSFFPLVEKIVNDNNMVVYLIAMGLFITDTSITVLSRILYGKNPLKAHNTYGFQILQKKYEWKHSKVTLIYLLISLLWYLPMAAASVLKPQLSNMLFYVAYFPAIIFFLKLRVGKH